MRIPNVAARQIEQEVCEFLYGWSAVAFVADLNAVLPPVSLLLAEQSFLVLILL